MLVLLGHREVLFTSTGLGVRHHFCALIVAWKGSQSHVLALRADVRVFLPCDSSQQVRTPHSPASQALQRLTPGE